MTLGTVLEFLRPPKLSIDVDLGREFLDGLDTMAPEKQDNDGTLPVRFVLGPAVVGSSNVALSAV